MDITRIGNSSDEPSCKVVLRNMYAVIDGMCNHGIFFLYMRDIIICFYADGNDTIEREIYIKEDNWKLFKPYL